MPGRKVRTRSHVRRHQEDAPEGGEPWSGSNVMADLTIRLVTKQGRGLLECGVSLSNGVGGMALDPESQRLLDLAAAANRPAWNSLSPEAAREQYLSLRPPSQGPRPAGVSVVDRTIPGPGGPLPLRIYRPASAAADAKLPALVFAHGGGWVFGNL